MESSNPLSNSNHFDFTISESVENSPSNVLNSKTSFLFERGCYDQYLKNLDTSYNTENTQENNFKHLEIIDLNAESNSIETKDKEKNKRKKYRRSLSLSAAEGEQLSKITLSKMGKTHKMISSADNFKKGSSQSLFSNRELIQPITARNSIGGNKYKPHSLKNLDELTLIGDNKETKFNKKICSKLNSYLKSHDSRLAKLPSVLQLHETALAAFDEYIINVTKERFPLKRTTSVDLVNSEKQRASTALIQVQKSMVLVKEMIPRLQFLQTSVYNVLLGYSKKKFQNICFKSKWINNFYNGLDKLICSYNFKVDEMNPLKTFTQDLKEQVTDQKIYEFILMAMQVESLEFESIKSCLNSWADFQKVKELTPRVGIIDHRRIKEKLDFSTDHIKKQQHQWFESLDLESRISQITPVEIIRCFIPDGLVLFKELKVNDQIIKLKSLEKDIEKCKAEFFTLLFQAIYKALNQNFSEKEIKAQTQVLINIENICRSIKNDLSEKHIDWKMIQNKLKDYTAIPFSKLKNMFDASLHLESFDRFLIGLVIPCIHILKLCTNSCWLRGDECIRHLFPNLFQSYGDTKNLNPFNTTADKGIYCHINIEDEEDFSVTQIRNYGIKPAQSSSQSSGDANLNYATTTFQWTVKPFKDKEKNVTCWQGILEIPKVEVKPETLIEIKKTILKVLNNPETVDYVANSLEGKPKILTSSK